jgi:hypothetical protein
VVGVSAYYLDTRRHLRQISNPTEKSEASGQEFGFCHWFLIAFRGAGSPMVSRGRGRNQPTAGLSRSRVAPPPESDLACLEFGWKWHAICLRLHPKTAIYCGSRTDDFFLR